MITSDFLIATHANTFKCRLIPFNQKFLKLYLNPFDPNAPFLYPLKTSENRNVYWCFQGLGKGCIGNE